MFSNVLKDWRVRAGFALGLGLVAGAAAMRHHLPTRGDHLPPHGPVLSDCDGAIEELVIQYVPEAAGIVETAYSEFLGSLPDEVTVRVICENKAAFEDFRGRLGAYSCEVLPVYTRHAMTCWSRDRWLAFSAARDDNEVLVLAPGEEHGFSVWQERAGDEYVAFDLARALDGEVTAKRSGLFFDGGDFVCDEETVFVTPRVMERNYSKSIPGPNELKVLLSETLQRKVVLLDDAPPHHAGMFMMPIGKRTCLVGSPSLARQILETDGKLFNTADFSTKTQARFDSVAQRCELNGYDVVRIPVAPFPDGRTYLTYLNVIIDERNGERTVFMPVYDNAAQLNEAAAKVWKDLGYKVVGIDCSDTYKHYGSLRCLVNVLRRSFE